MNYQLFEKVYTLVLTKVCNARFGEVLRNYSEMNHLKNKGKLGILAKLNGLVNGVIQKKEANKCSDSTEAPVPLPTFVVILLGGNGAIEEKIFSGRSFIISGLFEEVSSHAKTAFDKIKEMITSYGGKVNQRFSKNTSEYRFRVMIYCHINEL